MWGMRCKYCFIASVLSIFVLISTDIFGLNVQAKSDMKKLVNYNRMVSKHYTVYEKQRLAQYKSWRTNKIPKSFRIPIELQSYRGNNSVRYYGLYNPANKIGVGYIPSNLVQLYEEEAWAAYQELGNNAPSLSIVLAQQFTESAFNPWATGDNNKSFGLPQLYSNTAKYLYKTDRATWKKFFYFDKHGKHHFVSIRAMVKFPFVFLPKVKRYDFEHKFEGVRRYNGAGENAIKYAEKVMSRSLFYEELFASYNAVPLDTTGFKNNLFGMINLTLLARNEAPIDNALMDQIFSNTIAQFNKGYVKNTYMQNILVPVYEKEPLLVSQKTDYIIPTGGKDYYIIVEEGHVIYQYFNDAQILFEVLSNSKNKNYYLYYKEKKKKVRVTNLKRVGKRQVFSNVKPSDKIYIPPGTVLISPETNLAVRIN